MTMIPWGLRYNSWYWRMRWTYGFLWKKHPVIVILAGVGALSLLWLTIWVCG